MIDPFGFAFAIFLTWLIVIELRRAPDKRPPGRPPTEEDME